MELVKVKEELKNSTALFFGEYIIFDDFEVLKTTKEEKYNSLEEIVESIPELAKLIEEAETGLISLEGGRGSGSGAMGGGFGHADNRRGRKGEPKPEDRRYPATFNTGTRYMSQEKTLKKFQDMYGNAEIEYGITIDEDGFTHRHVKGGATSVNIHGNNGELIVHNHPSVGWGNFSDSDLLVVAQGPEKGIVATGTKGTYTFTKNKNFKAKEFIKAVKRAKWPTKYNYDQGADWWLKKNAKEYGYTYTKSAAVKKKK